MPWQPVRFVRRYPHPCAIMRIAAVYPSPCIASTPCLLNFLVAMAERGHSVSLWTTRSAEFGDPPGRAGIEIDARAESRRAFALRTFRSVAARAREFDAIVGMDRLGWLVAWGAGRRAGFRGAMVSFNVEIYRPPIFAGVRHAAANFAEAATARRDARWVLFPSRERADRLVADWRLDPARAVVLPNAPRGRAEARRSSVLRERYGIPPDALVLLYLGSLTSANRIEELLRAAAATWPPDCALVLHGRARAGDAERARLAEFARGARCAIRFTDGPVAPEELRDLAAGADVGLAPYPTEGVGFATMGSASGKIAEYLGAGTPFVATRLPSLETLVARRPGAGVCVDDFAEIPEAARRLVADGDAARARAAAAFDAEFGFDAAFEAFAPRLEEGIGGAAIVGGAIGARGRGA